MCWPEAEGWAKRGPRALDVYHSGLATTARIVTSILGETNKGQRICKNGKSRLQKGIALIGEQLTKNSEILEVFKPNFPSCESFDVWKKQLVWQTHCDFAFPMKSQKNDFTRMMRELA